MLLWIIIPLYLLGLGLLFFRCRGWLAEHWPGLPRGWKIAATAVYVTLALSPLVAFMLPVSAFQRTVKGVYNLWLGALYVAGLLFFIVEILGFLFRLISRRSEKLRRQRRRLFKRLGVAAVCLFPVIFGLGLHQAAAVRLTAYQVQSEEQALKGLRIALISDLHLGANVGLEQTQKVVDLVKAAHPDLVVIAGDIIDNDYGDITSPEKIAEVLRQLDGRYGVYACLGNHDVTQRLLGGFTVSDVTTPHADQRLYAFLESAGITLLSDEVRLVDDRFYLAGRKDYAKPEDGVPRQRPEALLSGLTADKPVVVIDHEPRELSELAAVGADLDLSGHTHDGQVFPGNLMLGMKWKNPCGVKQFGDMTSVVTSGAGTWGPAIRMGTASEVVVVEVE